VLKSLESFLSLSRKARSAFDISCWSRNNSNFLWDRIFLDLISSWCRDLENGNATHKYS
jgi:hypothetical protein